MGTVASGENRLFSTDMSSSRSSRVLLCALAALLVAIVAVFAVLPASAHAASYKSSRAVDVTVKVGDVSVTSEQYQKSDGSWTCKIVMNVGSKRKAVASDTASAFVTNGKYIFYAKRGKRTYGASDYAEYTTKNTIYRYTVSTGIKKKVIVGTDWIPLASNGTYLYAGRDNGAEGVKLYAVKVKTGAKTYMANHVGSVVYKSSRVVTSTNSGDLGNYALYLFKSTGKGKIKVAKGCGINIKSGKVYYVKCKQGTEPDYAAKFKLYTCTLNATSKKAVTGWQDTFPDKYV